MIQMHNPVPPEATGIRALGRWLADNIGWLIVAASIWLAPHVK